VGVNKRTGQEYTAIRALEQHVDPDEVVVEHHGMPTDRLRALRDGEVDAVSLLEPHSTLAEHLGFSRVFEFENHMGMVGAEEFDHETLVRFRRAYARAVRDINGNPEEFREAYLSMLEADEEVAPDLFEAVDIDELRADIEIPEYETPELANRTELDAHLEWMKARDLIDNEADIDRMVATGR
jgi:NitT/TauT family transport system substrate-binding protein